MEPGESRSAKRRNQGRQQRSATGDIAQAGEPSTFAIPTVFDSELAQGLVRDWSVGLISARTVQATALRSFNDQCTLLSRLNASPDLIPKSLSALADLGHRGRFPNNCKRDLLVYLGKPCAADIHIREITCKHGKLGADESDTVTVAMPFNLPHLVLAHAFEQCRSRFNSLFLGSEDGRGHLKEFWKTVVARRDPRIVRHPMCSKPEWTALALPISLHGDAVPAVGVGKSGSKSFDAYSWQSVLSHGPTSNIKNFIFGIFEDAKVPDVTMDQCWATLLWSLKTAFEGVWPTHDVDGISYTTYPAHSMERRQMGKPLAGGFSWFSGSSKETWTTSPKASICGIMAGTSSVNTARPIPMWRITRCNGPTSPHLLVGRQACLRSQSGG